MGPSLVKIKGASLQLSWCICRQWAQSYHQCIITSLQYNLKYASPFWSLILSYKLTNSDNIYTDRINKSYKTYSSQHSVTCWILWSPCLTKHAEHACLTPPRVNSLMLTTESRNRKERDQEQHFTKSVASTTNMMILWEECSFHSLTNYNVNTIQCAVKQWNKCLALF